jgi:bifunctional non-homologous end joining protein LigD
MAATSRGPTTEEPEKELLAELKKGHITFVLHGKKLKGEFALIRSEHIGKNSWLLIKKGDQYASKRDVTKEDKSVVSGRNC